MLNRIVLTLVILIFCLNCTTKAETKCFSTELIGFAKNDDLAAFKHCVANGSDIYLVDNKGENLYYLSSANGAELITNYLIELQLQDWNTANNALTPEMLYKAINFNNSTIAKAFIAAEFDMNQKYFNGITPIVEAIFADSYEVVALLLESGVDVNYQFDFRPLITIATMFNQPETVELLLAHGADINDIDGAGVTPLIFAAQDNNVLMVNLLLSYGADKQIEDVTARTAFNHISDDNPTLTSLLSTE